MRVLGIDPGYDRLGWGVVEKRQSLTYLDCGLITTPNKNSTLVQRLTQLSSDLHRILEQYHPDTIGIEELFFSNNQKTVIPVAEARGAILTTIGKWSSEVKINEYTPSQIKAVVAGDGQADKKAVEKMVRLQLRGIPEKLKDDTLDALAAALTVVFDSTYGR